MCISAGEACRLATEKRKIIISLYALHDPVRRKYLRQLSTSVLFKIQSDIRISVRNIYKQMQNLFGREVVTLTTDWYHFHF